MSTQVKSAIFNCPINDMVRIQFETDASNYYFDNNVGKGTLHVSHPSILKSVHLWNGICTLVIQPSLDSNSIYKIRDKISFNLTINEKGDDRFSEKFEIIISDPITKKKKKKGKGGKKSEPYGRKKVTNEELDGDAQIGLPKTKRLSKETNEKEWNEVFSNIYQGAVFKRSGKRLMAYINISNPNLLEYVKRHKNHIDPNHIFNAYENLVGLIPFGMYLLNESGLLTYDEKNQNVLDRMSNASDALALMGIDVVFLIKASRI